MSPQFLAIAPAIVLTAICLDILPRRPRRGLYFGVTTGPKFARSTEGRTIARRYRMVVWFGSALALALAFFGSPVVALFMQIGLGLVAWLRAWRRTSHHAIPSGPAPTAPLQYDDTISSWTTPLLLAAFAVLAIAGATLYLNYGSLPDRLPTHYGISGKADAFQDKSYGIAFLPLVIGALALSLLALNIYGIAFGSRRGGTPETQALRTGQRQYLSRLFAAVALALSLLFGYLTVAPVISTIGLPGGPWVILAFVTGIVGFSVWAVLNFHEHAGGSGDNTPDSCWKGGLIYYNPADPALMVERRNGIGYTPNFAQPLAWAIVALVVAMVAAPFLMRSIG